MSSTVAKALTLLDFFSEDEPEIGLSDLARRSGVDKATVHRMLNVMADAGLVEQQADSRLYRLGAGVLRLARVRETAFPVASVVQPLLEELAKRTGETAHASLISGRSLATIGIRESARGSRVSLISGEVLPLHSTASGLATTALSSRQFRDRVLTSQLEKKTQQTVTDPSELQSILETVQQKGFAESDQTNEIDVYGIAAPIFDRTAAACGAVAVATPSHRLDDNLRFRIIPAVLLAARDVTSGMGGQMPQSYAKALSRTLSEFDLDVS